MPVIFPGSPPLTREQHQGTLEGTRRRRITPAYAGTTDTEACHLWLHRDHPRLRGNNFLIHKSICLCTGSPPLTREQLDVHGERQRNLGITPAYAGTTSRISTATILHRDHPRLRGNNQFAFFFTIRKPGSPPLTREQRQKKTGQSHGTGITPAYAGTTV